MLEIYGDKLDIIFDDDLYPTSTYGYKQLVSWDDPSVLPTPKPTSTPTSTPEPKPTPKEDSPINIVPIGTGGGIMALLSIIATFFFRRK